MPREMHLNPYKFTAFRLKQLVWLQQIKLNLLQHARICRRLARARKHECSWCAEENFTRAMRISGRQLISLKFPFFLDVFRSSLIETLRCFLLSSQLPYLHAVGKIRNQTRKVERSKYLSNLIPT